MKKTALIIGILILTITGYSQKKVEIARMLVDRVTTYMNEVLVDEYSTTDTILYEPETEDFVNAVEYAFENYYAACNTTTIDYDSSIALIEAEIAHLENKFSEEKLLRIARYRQLKIRLAQYQEIVGEQLNEWVQPTGAHDAYQMGDKVLYNGKEWESLINANVWKPGVSGWREI